MRRTLRLAMLTFAVSLAVFAPTAGALHDSPNSADIIGADVFDNAPASATIDVNLLVEGKSNPRFQYTVTVYDEAGPTGELDTATLGGDGTTEIMFAGLDVSANGTYSCGNPATGDHSIFIVVESATPGGHVFDTASTGYDFCFPPSDIGFD